MSLSDARAMVAGIINANTLVDARRAAGRLGAELEDLGVHLEGQANTIIALGCIVRALADLRGADSVEVHFPNPLIGAEVDRILGL
ncbi:MAG TPA: hypothetical protein VGF92_15850 [Stellaceae bacterium]